MKNCEANKKKNMLVRIEILLSMCLGKRGGYNGQTIAERTSNGRQDANSKVSDFLSSSSYAESLGIHLI